MESEEKMRRREQSWQHSEIWENPPISSLGKWLGHDAISQNGYNRNNFEKKTDAQSGIYLNRGILSGTQVTAELTPMGEINIKAQMEDEGKNNVTPKQHTDRRRGREYPLPLLMNIVLSCFHFLPNWTKCIFYEMLLIICMLL